MAEWYAFLGLTEPSVSDVIAMERYGRLVAIPRNFGEIPGPDLSRCVTPRGKQGLSYPLRLIAATRYGSRQQSVELTASVTASGAGRMKPWVRSLAPSVRWQGMMQGMFGLASRIMWFAGTVVNTPNSHFPTALEVSRKVRCRSGETTFGLADRGESNCFPRVIFIL